MNYIQLIITYFPWIMSIIGISVLFLSPGTWRFTWYLSLFNQVLSFIWIWYSKQFGFIPLTIGYTVVSVLNEIALIEKLKKIPTTKIVDKFVKWEGRL